MTRSFRTRLALLVAGVLISYLTTTQAAFAQNRSATVGAFATVGGGNTQFPDYADNALGFNFGAFYQRSPLLGAEVRGGVYPVSARYTQAPITAGYRLSLMSTGSHGRSRNSPVEGNPWSPFLYFGGGISYSQDSGSSYLNPPLSPQVAPCWEISGGLDRDFGRFAWRIAEISWVKTYMPDHDLGTSYLSTGIVYHFKN